MLIKDIINETMAGAIAGVAMPMGKMIKRKNPSVFPKKKKNEDATGKQEDEFHKKLDKLVHKTFGHSSDEKKKKKKTNEISDFKKRELEYELRNEKNNYAVKINGKVWKVVASRSQAQKMVRTLQNRGKDASFVETGMPLSEGASREKAVEILVALVKERGLDNFANKDEIESYMADNMPAFYQGRDTGKAIEDAVAKLDIDEGKSPHKKGTKKYKAHMAAMHAG